MRVRSSHHSAVVGHAELLKRQAPGARTRLSEDLHALLAHSGGRAMALRDIVEALGERGHALVAIVLAFPFLLPVPTMGLSAPSGISIAVMGLCVLLGLKPVLPGLVARREIPHATLEGVVGGAERIAARFEHLLKPRLDVMLWRGPHLVLGLGLVFAGIVLGLPIPLPLANAIPAVAILLYAGGMLERDGIFVLAGHVVNAAMVVLGVVLWEVVWAAMQRWLPALS